MKRSIVVNFIAILQSNASQNRASRFAMKGLLVLVFMALFSGFIANEKPYVAVIEGKTYFPLFHSISEGFLGGSYPNEMRNFDWKNKNADFILFPPIPYLPSNIDLINGQSKSPFDKQEVRSILFRHWLGTDELGRDVLAGLVHGSTIALKVGFFAMTIALIIGLLFGSVAGFFGDSRLSISRASIIGLLLFLFPSLFYGFIFRENILEKSLADSFVLFFLNLIFSIFIFLGILFIAWLLFKPLKIIPFFRKRVNLPLDFVLMRGMEIFTSVPTFFLLVAVIAVAKPSISLVILIIGLTSWTGIAKYTRAELLRIRSLDYIESAESLGYSHLRILFQHALPNALSPVIVSLAFGISNAILLESALSFLGLGFPADTITWGSMLAEARMNSSAWWLALFPGLAIFFTVTMCNFLGENIRDEIDPKKS